MSIVQCGFRVSGAETGLSDGILARFWPSAVNCRQVSVKLVLSICRKIARDPQESVKVWLEIGWRLRANPAHAGMTSP